MNRSDLWSELVDPNVGLRAGLLRSGVLDPVDVAELLASLEVDGARPWVELSEEEQTEVRRYLDEAVGGPTVPRVEGSPWSPYLERARAMLYRYAVVHRPTEWVPGREDQVLAATIRVFLGVADAAPSEVLAQLDERLAQRPLAGDDDRASRYHELVHAFRLSAEEEDALWLFLAPAFSREFHWLYTALLRRSTDGALPLHFAAEILGDALGDLEGTVAILGERRTLRRYRLIEALPNTELFRAPERVLEHIVAPSSPGVPVSLSGVARIETRGPAIDPRLAMSGLSSELPKLLRSAARERRTCFLAMGPIGCGGRALARLVAMPQSMEVLTVDVRALLDEPQPVWHEVMREALLQNALLFLRNIADAASHPSRDRLLSVLGEERLTIVVEVGTDLAPEVLLSVFEHLEPVPFALEVPEAETRHRLWSAVIEASQMIEGEAAQAEFARSLRTYPFGLDQIEDAVRLGRIDAMRRGGKPSLDGFHSACQSVLTHRLGELAVRVRVLHRWEDVVMDAELQEQVDTLLHFGRLSSQVLDAWGYGERLSYGRGLSALFSGPSGTGKTMVAGLVADELGMDLYRIDLSRMVSKYIGETEERLNQAFEEARVAKCALLFDEADSLFGKRTEVKSSNDRYANLEVNYLLQKLEEHEGVVLLTTNFPNSIDSAFMRRIRFRIHFPKPDASLREQLWRRMIPEIAPQEADLRLGRLAAAFDLSGGEIRNAVLRAALYAAASGRPLAAEDLFRSARAEYRQLGHLLRDEDEPT